MDSEAGMMRTNGEASIVRTRTVKPLTLIQQSCCFSVVPALAGGFAPLLIPGSTGIIVSDTLFALSVIASIVIAHRTAARMKIIADNGYRLANNLPTRRVEGGAAEVQEIDSMLVKLHDQLELAASRYRACLTNSSDVICTLNEDLTFMMSNEATSQLWGYESFYMVGRMVTTFLAEADHAPLIEGLLKAKQTPSQPVATEVALNKSDGTIAWTLWTVTWSERQQLFFCVVRDTTQQRQVEQLKREFINMLSHDLRSPLLSFSAFTELLQSGAYGPLNASGSEMASAMRSSINRSVQMISDLLDLEKMEDGKLDLEYCDLVMSEIVADATSSLLALAQSKGVQIVAPAASFCPVLADPSRMVQVVQNLLSNALKFAPRDSEIQISTIRGDDFVEVRVCDQGPGIPEDKISKVFDRFEQVKGSVGTGLGLAICRQVLRQHDGEIGVFNNDGAAGCTFWFRVPLQRQFLPETTAEQPVSS